MNKAINWLATLPGRTGRIPRSRLAASLAAVALIPLIGCGRGSPSTNSPTQNSERPPIDPAVLRAEVERHADWPKLRKAACPRQLPDRHEEIRLYPAVSVLEGLGYIKITDGIAYNMYVKNMEITEAGRRELGNYLEEQTERYVITIARREYLAGTERFEILPHLDRLIGHFQWRWVPLNGLGERLTLVPPSLHRGEYGGFVTYSRTPNGWTLDKVFLNSQDKDYMYRVTRVHPELSLQNRLRL